MRSRAERSGIEHEYMVAMSDTYHSYPVVDSSYGNDMTSAAPSSIHASPELPE